jgi:UDP-N-acetylmuramoyl-tripeptide--D-alanyl-D-alanine ligase
MKEKLKVKDLLSWSGSKMISGIEEFYIKNISTDSRTLKRGDFFIPLKGENYNGHDFIAEALRKKASGFVFESDQSRNLNLWEDRAKEGNLEDIIIIESRDNLDFLKKVAYRYIRKFKPFAIGITGSAGKTTTKNFLVSVMSRGHRVDFTPKNFNNEIGVSKSVLEIKRDTEFFIAELGMRGKDQIRSLADMCNLRLGAITCIGQSHTAFFENMEEIALAKAEITDILLRNKGVLFLNNDDEFSNLVEKKAGCRVMRFGRDGNLSFSFIEKEMDSLGRFTFSLFRSHNKVMDIKLNIPGYHNIYNACCAAAISLYLDVSVKDVKKGIEEAVIEKSRMEVIKRKRWIVIDDCYNANPVSVKRAIDTLVLAAKKSGMRSVAILGDMLELGSDSQALHEEIGRYLSEKNVDLLIATGEFAKNIYDGYMGSGNLNKNKNESCYFIDKKELYKKINTLVKPEDLILVKGSRAKKMEDIINLL